MFWWWYDTDVDDDVIIHSQSNISLYICLHLCFHPKENINTKEIFQSLTIDYHIKFDQNWFKWLLSNKEQWPGVASCLYLKLFALYISIAPAQLDPLSMLDQLVVWFGWQSTQTDNCQIRNSMLYRRYILMTDSWTFPVSGPYFENWYQFK